MDPQKPQGLSTDPQEAPAQPADLPDSQPGHEDPAAPAVSISSTLDVTTRLLVLRQMGRQLCSKLARYCISGIDSPYQARHATFKRITTHPRRNDERILKLLGQYPDLEAGLEALSLLQVPEGSSALDYVPDIDGPMSSETLDEYVCEEFRGSDALEVVSEVILCLATLAVELLKEPLFVDLQSRYHPVTGEFVE